MNTSISIVNKLLLVVLLASVNVYSSEAKEIEMEASGHGNTLHEANVNAYDKARYRVMAFEPTAVYTWMRATNGSSRSKVVQVPAQIIGVDVVSTEVTVINTDEGNPNLAFEDGVLVDTDLDEFGFNLSSTYMVKTKFKFQLRNAQDVDRAKYLGEVQALRDIVSGKSLQSKNTFQNEGYGVVSDQLIATQKKLLTRKEEGRALTKQKSFDEITKEVQYFKDNIMSAIARTYPEPTISKLKTTIRGGEEFLVLDIKLGEGCVLDKVEVSATLIPADSDSNPVGGLCDLWAQLPDQVEKTIEKRGLANGNNIDITPTASFARAALFVQNPLFFPHSFKNDRPFPLVYFQRPEDISGSFFYSYPNELTDEEKNGGLQQMAMPTSRSKNIAPIGHETMLDKMGIITKAPDRRLLPGVTDAYSNAVLPDFFATAMVGKSPVTLTIFDLKKKVFTDIPLTSNKFLLTSRLEVSIKSLDVPYSKEDFGLVVWWGEHPANSGWTKNEDPLSFPTLTHHVDAKMQMDILNFYRNNKEELMLNNGYKTVRQFPTSPGAFSSLYYSCVINDEDLCSYRAPSLFKTKVIAGGRENKHELLATGSNPMDQEEACWMYDRSSMRMNTCKITAQNLYESWWLEIGQNPLPMRKHVAKSDLWRDLNHYTKEDVLVLESEYSKKVVQGRVTIPVTNPQTVW